MAKSRSNRKSILKTMSRTAKGALPVVDKGLVAVGNTAKNVAENSIPVVEKGVSAVYGTMATGFDLGVKGVKTVAKGVTKKRHSRRHRKGGRKRTRHHRRH
jgi:hypothetical protein